MMRDREAGTSVSTLDHDLKLNKDNSLLISAVGIAPCYGWTLHPQHHSACL